MSLQSTITASKGATPGCGDPLGVSTDGRRIERLLFIETVVGGVVKLLSELGFVGLEGFLGFCCCGLGGVALGWVVWLGESFWPLPSSSAPSPRPSPPRG